MTIARLRMGLSGPSNYEVFKFLFDNRFVSKETVSDVSIDSVSANDINQWLDNPVMKFEDGIMVYYRDHDFLSIDNKIVKMCSDHYEINPKTLLEDLVRMDFELASIDSTNDDWSDNEGYEAPGFASLHFEHGWACAFQGKGHNRLVSRRWLEHGPWRVLKGDNDTTLVQFHDLEADSDTGLAQARIGHKRMGISEEGGFISRRHPLTHEIDGLYEPQDKKLKVVVMSRDVSQTEMCDACAVKINNRLGPDQPVESVAYIFMEEHEARAHLHELWLRKLECWTIIDGQEVRLDLDYKPKPEKPDWVNALEAREAGEK